MISIIQVVRLLSKRYIVSGACATLSKPGDLGPAFGQRSMIVIGTLRPFESITSQLWLHQPSLSSYGSGVIPHVSSNPSRAGMLAPAKSQNEGPLHGVLVRAETATYWIVRNVACNGQPKIDMKPMVVSVERRIVTISRSLRAAKARFGET